MTPDNKTRSGEVSQEGSDMYCLSQELWLEEWPRWVLLGLEIAAICLDQSFQLSEPQAYNEEIELDRSRESPPAPALCNPTLSAL